METLTLSQVSLLKEPTREEYVGTPTGIMLNPPYTLLAGASVYLLLHVIVLGKVYLI